MFATLCNLIRALQHAIDQLYGKVLSCVTVCQCTNTAYMLYELCLVLCTHCCMFLCVLVYSGESCSSVGMDATAKNGRVKVIIYYIYTIMMLCVLCIVVLKERAAHCKHTAQCVCVICTTTLHCNTGVAQSSFYSTDSNCS